MPADQGTGRAAELVAIAYRHIAGRGFEGLRIRAVADEAGINQATLLYYFPNKGELIRAVVAHIAEDFQKPRVQQPDGGARNAWEELALEIEDARARFLEEPDLVVVLTELDVHSRRDEEVAQVLSELYGRWANYLTGIIERGKTSGLFRADIAAAPAASMIMAQFRGIFGLRLTGVSNNALEERLLREFRVQLERWLMSGGGERSRP